MKRFFLYLIILFNIACSKKDKTVVNHNVVNDSIDFYLQRSGNFDLSEPERFVYANKAYNLISNQNTDSLNFVNRYYVAFDYFNLNKLNNYKSVISSTLDLAIKEHDSMNMARSFFYLGDYYYAVNQNDSAYYNFYQAEKLFFKLKKNKLIGKSYIKKAQTQIKEKDYLGSEKSAVTALNYIRIEGDKVLEYDAYNILGLSCLEIKDFERSLDYFNKMLKIATETNIEDYYQTKALALLNIGKVYQQKDNHREALNYFEKAIKEPNLYNEIPSLYGSILDEMTYSKFRLGRLENTPSDFYKALKILKPSKSIPHILGCKIHISEYYESLGKIDSARKYADLAYKLSKDSKIINLQLKALNQLTKVYPENANAYSKEYLTLNDSVIKMERSVAEKFARIEYETDEFKKQKEQLASQNRNIILFALLAVFIVVLLYIIRDQRSRNKYFRLREEQQKANEEIYSLMLSQQKKLDEVVLKEKQRIGQELHDGVLGRLFGARLNLDSLNRKDDELAIAGRDHYIAELKFIEQDIREISHELSREKFALINNFVAILTNLFEEQKNLSEATDLKYSIDQAIKWDKVDNDLKINLYRIIQESLQNINKYAKAKTVLVNLLKDADHLHITIMDDGVGFDTNKKSKGIGLQNITSRVESCKGTFELKSKPGKGTTITIDLPFKK